MHYVERGLIINQKRLRFIMTQSRLYAKHLYPLPVAKLSKNVAASNSSQAVIFSIPIALNKSASLLNMNIKRGLVCPAFAT